MILFVVYLAFVSLGLPDGVIGLAWPTFRADYGLPQVGFALLLLGAGPGYFVAGLIVGRVLDRFGLARTLVTSTALVTVGLALVAAAPPWPLPILALAIVGLGSGTIDAGINAFAAARFRPRDVNWLHACYSLGAAIGPATMTASLAGGLGWRGGYAILAAALLVLTAVFAAAGRGLVMPRELARADRAAAERVSPFQALRHPLVPIQTLLFFLYTGLENTLGAWAYSALQEGRGVSPAVAGFWVSAYFAAILGGRVALGALVERIGSDRLVRLGTYGALAGALLFAAGPPVLAFAGLVVAGVSLAPIYPTLISRTADRLDPAIAVHAVGFKVSAAMIGAAALPVVTSFAAEWIGLESVGPICVLAGIAVVATHERLLVLARRHARPAVA